MALNQNQIDIGQGGGAYLDDTGAFTPPTGKVVTAIYIVTANTSFALLTPDNKDGLHYPGTSVVATAAGNGANAEAIAEADNFPADMWIYGRFTAITLADGAIFAYFSEE